MAYFITIEERLNLMIDRWAAFLNISNWFQWRGFEDVPPDYGRIGFLGTVIFRNPVMENTFLLQHPHHQARQAQIRSIIR
jgi:hypothetical protein